MRGPEELAQMLERLEIHHFAFISFSDDNITELDAQIDALERHKIDLVAAYWTSDADAPLAKQTLEVFKRHDIHPQLWVALPPKVMSPQSGKERRRSPPYAASTSVNSNSGALSNVETAGISRTQAVAERDVPRAILDQRGRMAQESIRLQALVKLARPYGVKVEIYHKRGWFGMVQNEIATIESLKARGIMDVGIVYNFSEVRDEVSDYGKEFPEIWKEIQPYVVAVNVAGFRGEDHVAYPSQGDRELAMMRTIQDSGWTGLIGVIAEKGGDAEVTLGNDIIGLDWLAAELKQAGSGGRMPFPRGFDIFQARCAICHEKGSYGAPATPQLSVQTPSSIYSALTTGRMREQAALLSDIDRRQVAEYLTGRPMSKAASPRMCGDDHTWFDERHPPVGMGWGIDAENTRSIPADQARLDKKDLSSLKVKWVFAFPDAIRAATQPLAAGGGLFVASQDGSVYALNAQSGCAHWMFKASAEIDGMVIHTSKHGAEQPLLFFGDRFGIVYALDATTGRLKWKVRIDEHPDTEVMGTPVWWADRLYVPVASAEEVSVGLKDYPCCTFRGSLVALNPATGEVIWKRYSISSPPVERFKNSQGLPQYGPSGAGLWRSPTIDEKRGSIYFTTGNGYSGPPNESTDAIFALDLVTGEVKWHVQTLTEDIFPCMQDSKQVPDPGGNCAGLQKVGPDLDLTTAPVLIHGRKNRDILVAGRKDGTVFGVDPDGGKILWSQRISHSSDPYMASLYWGLMAQDGRIFVPSLGSSEAYLGSFIPSPDDGLYALDAFTGKTLWTAPVANDCNRTSPCAGLGFAPIGTPGVIFAGAMDGTVRAYETVSGRVLWHFDTARGFTTLTGEVAKGGAVAKSGILIANGMLYINSGYLEVPGNVLLAFSINGK